MLVVTPSVAAKALSVYNGPCVFSDEEAAEPVAVGSAAELVVKNPTAGPIASGFKIMIPIVC